MVEEKMEKFQKHGRKPAPGLLEACQIFEENSSLCERNAIMITPERPVTVGSKYKGGGKFEIVLKEAQSEDLGISWIIVDRKD